MRYAVLDTGSNTIRLGIYEYENNSLTEIYNQAIFANLAGYINNNTLAPDGIIACADAIKVHQKTAAEYGVKLHPFATAAIRNAENTEEIVESVTRLTGETLDVLTGEEEALFSFYGAREDFPVESGVLADVGGGSSEIIAFSGTSPTSLLSVPWGSKNIGRTFSKHAIPTKAEGDAMQNAILECLSKKQEFTELKTKNLCIVGGGVRASLSLLRAFLGEESISGSSLNRLISVILENPNKAEDIILKTVPKRKDTICPALFIYKALADFFGSSDIFVSDKGIKEGYILKKLIK